MAERVKLPYKLFNRIEELHKLYSPFNSRTLTIADFEFLAKKLGVYLVKNEGAMVQAAGSVSKYKGSYFIFYYPHLSPPWLISTLGHEIGHIWLGHLDLMSEHSAEYFIRYLDGQAERDAFVIGYLCLIPTSYLLKWDEEGTLTPKKIFLMLWEMRQSQPDCKVPCLEGTVWHLTQARLRVYESYKRGLKRRGLSLKT